MEARNRDLDKWFSRIEVGEVLLPRFQRHEVEKFPGGWEANSLAVEHLQGCKAG